AAPPSSPHVFVVSLASANASVLSRFVRLDSQAYYSSCPLVRAVCPVSLAAKLPSNASSAKSWAVKCRNPSVASCYVNQQPNASMEAGIAGHVWELSELLNA